MLYTGTYELNFLELCEKINILDFVDNGPTTRYYHETKNHIYYPDFYIEKMNLIIEIKSTYTLEQNLNLNLSKRIGCEKSGYNFIFIVDKNYSDFLKLYNDSQINKSL